MELLQGGVQNGLQGKNEYVIAVSTAGFTLSYVDSGASIGYCSLANTISADITESVIYICTIDSIYSLNIDDVAGDSTASLVSLGVTISDDIISLRAEKKFIALATTVGITLLSLPSLTQQSLTFSVKFIDTYKSYLAFCSNTEVYTYCVDANSFTLANCYSPQDIDIEEGFTKLLDYPTPLSGVMDNFISPKALEAPTAAIQLFGAYQDKRAMPYTSHAYDMQWGWEFDLGNLNYYDLEGKIQSKHVVKDHYNKELEVNAKPALDFMHVWRTDYGDDFFTLDTSKPLKDTLPVKITRGSSRLVADINWYSKVVNSKEPDRVFYIDYRNPELLTSTKFYFTIPDEVTDSIGKAAIVGSLETMDKMYGWGLITSQNAADDPDTFLDHKLFFLVFDKASEVCTCTHDTYRSDAVTVMPRENELNSNYFSGIFQIEQGYFFIDKVYDNAEWASSGKAKRLTLFSINESTDVLTAHSQTDIINVEEELFHSYVKCGNSQLFHYTSNGEFGQFYVPKNSVNKIFSSITVLELGKGLLIAEDGVGIHFSSKVGNWKKFLPEVDTVLAADIFTSSGGDMLLAYSTAAKVRVLDL